MTSGLAQPSSAVVGRAAELDALRRLVERARHGPAAAVLVGEAGIGKTTVWEAGAALAREGGFRILVSRPARADATLPLGSLGDLFRDITAADLGRVPAPQRRALEVALLLEEGRDEAADQRLLAVATVSLLRALATPRTPLLLALDDVQWLDESSAGILAFAARRLGAAPVALLLSARAEEAAADPLELRDALGVDRLERLELGPLSLAALHGMFASRLGHSFPRLTLGRIAQASGGNPFYALEVGRALERSGEAADPGRPLPIPTTLAALTRARLAALPARTRKALVLAAAAFEPTLATLSRAGRADPEAALQAAVRAGIVRIDGTTVRFSHPLLADAVLAALDAPTLRRTHTQLAAAARSEDARARHLGAAATGADEEAAAALEQAAERAQARGASLDAVALYERASLLTPDAARASARALRAAQAAFLDLADLRHADAILERALERGPDGPGRAEARSLRAMVWYYHGRQADAATSLCEQALAEAGASPVVRAKVLLRVAYLHAQVDMERSQAEILEANRLLERAEEPVQDDLLGAALLDRASAALQMATGLRRRDISRGIRLHATTARSWEWERADSVVYELARHTDDLEAALAKLTEQIARRADRGGEDPFWLVHVSLMHAWLGDWTSARAWAERALAAYEREGGELWPAFALRGIALVDALQGRVVDARGRSEEGLRLALASGDLVVAILHRQILGFVALSTGELVEAGEQLEAAATLAVAVGARHPLRFRLDGDRAEVALALGETARAEEIVERLEHAGRRAPTPWTLAVGARCRALLEAATGDLDAALTAVDRALVEHARLPMPFERARTLLVKGQVHHRRKEKRLAHDALEEALRSFEELGAPLWAARVRPELARVGVGARSRSELGETERRVAHLAAEGLSNQEIAQRAFLSVKTVEASLTRVYRKLGVRSRSGLARALAAAPPDSPQT